MATQTSLATKVRIDVHGPDGNIDVEFVDLPTPREAEDLSDWFNEHVYPHTDQGAGPAADSGNSVTATAVIISSDRLSLQDESIEWG